MQSRDVSVVKLNYHSYSDRRQSVTNCKIGQNFCLGEVIVAI